MKKALLFVLVFLCLTSVVFAEQWIIEPRYYDLQPNDNFMDGGTSSNPYVIKDSWGNTQAEIRPRYFDFNPNDNFMDAGTSTNPYIIDWE